MTYEPYNEDTESLLSQSHRQTFAVRANHPDWDEPMELDAEQVELIWDEEVAPRVQATLVMKVPEDQATIDLFDPRTGVRIEIDAGYIWPGGTQDIQPIADLGLRERRIDRPSNRMTLRAASDEALVIDNSPAIAVSATGATTGECIKELVWQALNPDPSVSITAAQGLRVTTIDPVTDRWATIDDLADRIEANVYDTGLRNWVIEDRTESISVPSIILQVGSNGTIIDSTTVLSRENWYNYVELHYVWTDSSDVEHEVIATAYIADTAYSVTGEAGKRIYLEERPVPTTQSKANAAAATVLKRFMSRAKGFDLSAISAYWLRPGMTASVLLPAGEQEKHIVSAVVFDLVTGRMRVRTRLPIPATVDTTTPAGTVTVIDETNTETETAPPPKESEPEPTPTKVYRSTWSASNSGSYQSDGDKRGDTNDMYQGYFSGTNGNQFSVAVFTDNNSTGDETGKTITQALSGASIRKVEAFFDNSHWYYGSGGKARVGWYNGTTVPASLSSSATNIVKQVDGWKPGAGKWVDITTLALKNNLLDGSCRGISLGPGRGTNRSYYGYFAGHSASSSRRPKIRITYVK